MDVDSCLASTHPELAKEWHSQKNLGLALTPYTITKGSNKKVWWQCGLGHTWQAAVYNRAGNNSGCPYCSKHARACQDNCLSTVNPELAGEWHPTKNGDLAPADVTKGSNKKVWWVCGKGHEWQSTINDRSAGDGCPYCSGQKACQDNCLSTVRPDLVSEWHPTKNGKLSPEDVTAGSNKKVWWLCSKGHRWRTSVRDRLTGTHCPYCVGKKVLPETCLATVNPELASEWHPTRNQISAAGVLPYSRRKVWWVCAEGHEWQSTVNNRSRGSSCPQCFGGPVSAASQRWLDSLGVPAEHREVSIRLPGKKRPIHVDGFDPASNTVYEFLGDYWHGNPEVYDFNDINPTSRAVYGTLYRKTIRRLEQLRKAGYSVVFVWEKDFLASNGGKRPARKKL